MACLNRIIIFFSEVKFISNETKISQDDEYTQVNMIKSHYLQSLMDRKRSYHVVNANSMIARYIGSFSNNVSKAQHQKVSIGLP